MLGIGRFGGIAGSFLVAELARRQLPFGQVFMVVAAAALVSMAARRCGRRWTCTERRSPSSLVLPVRYHSGNVGGCRRQVR